jgi:hypothetical protein
VVVSSCPACCEGPIQALAQAKGSEEPYSAYDTSMMLVRCAVPGAMPFALLGSYKHRTGAHCRYGKARDQRVASCADPLEITPIFNLVKSDPVKAHTSNSISRQGVACVLW